MQRILILAFATLALAVAAGCGGGGGSSASSVPPETWAGDICGAASSWTKDLQTQSESLQDTVTGATSIEDVRDRLVEFVDDAIARTEQMLDEVEAAGSPDVEDGEQLADDFQEVLSGFSTALEDVKKTAEGLQDDPAQFMEGVQQIGTTMGDVSSDIQTGMEDLQDRAGSGELAEAFDNEPACQELQN